jgi:hypothetical protein
MGASRAVWANASAIIWETTRNAKDSARIVSLATMYWASHTIKILRGNLAHSPHARTVGVRKQGEDHRAGYPAPAARLTTLLDQRTIGSDHLETPGDHLSLPASVVALFCENRHARGNRNVADRAHHQSDEASAGNRTERANLCPRLALLTPWSSHMVMAVFRQISQETEGANEFHTELHTIMVFCRPK